MIDQDTESREAIVLRQHAQLTERCTVIVRDEDGFTVST